MALSEGYQKFAYNRFMMPFVQENIWMGYVQDFSGWFANGGNTLSIPTDKGSRPDAAGNDSYEWDDVSATYTVDAAVANMAWGAPTATDLDTVELVLNRTYKINKIVSAIADRRVIPNLIAMRGAQAARTAREVVNNQIRATLLGIDASQQRTPIAVTAANFSNTAATGHDTFLTSLLDEFGAAQLAADVAFWPTAGRVAVVSPRIHKYLVDKLQKEKLFVLNTNEALVREGEVLRFKGWDIVKDNSARDGVSNSDDDKHAIFYLRRGEGLGFGADLRMLDVIRSETYIGNLLQGVMAWGTAVIEKEKLLVCKMNIT